MKLGRKALVIILIIIISVPILVLTVPSIVYSPPTIKSIAIEGQEGPNIFRISAVIVNNVGFSLYIKEGKLNVFNDIGEIGYIELKDLNLPSNQPLTIKTSIYVKEGEALNDFISKLLTEGRVLFYYSGIVKVSMPVLSFLTVDLNIPKSNSTFSLENPSYFITISKISLSGQENARVYMKIKNPTPLSLTIVTLNGNIYYGESKIGSLNYTNLIELYPNDYSEFFVDTKLGGSDLSKAISDLITNKNITLIWKGNVTLLLGSLSTNFNAIIEKKIDFDFSIDAKVNSVSFVSEKVLEVNVDAFFKISESFDLAFKINKLNFIAYSGNEKIGVGELSNLNVEENPVKNVTLKINIEETGLPSLIGLFFSGKSVTLTISNITGSIEILGNKLSISSNRRISVSTGYESLGINIEIKVYSISPAKDSKGLNVTLKLSVQASNIKLLKLELIKPRFLIYEPQTNTSLIIQSSDLVLSDQSSTLISIFLSLNDPATNKIFSLFATQGRADFILKGLNSTLKIGNRLLPITLTIAQKIEVTPLGLVGVKASAGFITSPSLGIFELTLNVTVNLKSDFPISLYIYQVTYDVYSEDGRVVIAKNATLQPRQYEETIPIVILVGSGNKTFIANAKVSITQEGLRWIAEQALQSDFIKFTLKNITVYLKLFDLPLRLYIPEYSINAELFPRLSVKVSQFDFFPGKKAQMDAQVYSPNYRIPINLYSLTFELNDAKTLTKFANGSLIKLYANQNGSLLNGRFALNFIGKNPLSYVGPLIKGEETLIYGTDVKIVAEVGGKPLELFLFKTLFVRVSSLIEIETNATLESFTVVPSNLGADIIGNGILNVTLKQGLNAPLNFDSAQFNVIAPISGQWKRIGSGELLTTGSFVGNSASLNLKARVSLNKEGFAYFGQNLLSTGNLLVKLTNVTIHVKIHDIEGDIPFVDILLPIKGPNIMISISNVVVKRIDWGLSGMSVVVRSITLSVDVTIKNPFNFTVTLNNIKFDVYHSSGAFLGRGTIYQQVILAAGSSVTVQNIEVKVTNISPIYQNLQVTIISLFPLRVQACVSGVLVFAKGTATAMVYDISFPLTFITPKQAVPKTCAVLSS